MLIQSAKLAILEERKILHEILRYAYEATEVEVWGEHYVRIDFDGYNQLIEKGEIIAAWLADEPVGSIHTYQRKPDTWSFSLLSADFKKKGNGIGQALIDAAEARAKSNGASFMQLEILRPRDMEVPFKIRLDNWYRKLGYEFTHAEDFSKVMPVKARNLVNPCNFDYYRKKL
ncbi:MAG: GNAT family N-acetyltransferase [Crocinitomicaceae bacterium]